MTPIEMDGDLYQLRLPTVAEWNQIKDNITISPGDSIPVGHIIGDWILILDHKVAELLHGKQIDENAHYIFRRDRDGAVFGDTEALMALVLCLVPLDKRGNPIDSLFGLNNPNGTVLTGGEWSYTKPRLLDTMNGTLIKWIVSNGKLFSKEPIYYANETEMEDIFEFF